jgi:purine-cytosine permease-like protein
VSDQSAVELSPVAAADRNQSPLDLFLIFAGANIVATTLQVGASLVPAFGLRQALAFIAFGSVAGAGLVAALAPLGPRLGVPSVIACRAALGWRGASLVALLLYVTNFAWIAVNNVIAASACARLYGGPRTERLWAFGLGLLAAAIVARGPRAVGLADRVAVPTLLVVGVVLTIACLRLPRAVLTEPGTGGMSWPRGLDIVIGYQVSWILMFADYSRYTRSVKKGTAAVFLGLAVTSLWFIPLGFISARAARSAEPGAMLDAVGLGAAGALLLTLATLTTNFVNIYLSSLAWKSLVPRTSDAVSVWSIGIIGALLSLLKGWLDRYADFMLLLGGLLVPVGGILLAHFFFGESARTTDVAALYDPKGPTTRHGGFSVAGIAAWVSGAAAYFLAGATGGTLPALLASLAVYAVLSRVLRSRPALQGA